GCDFGDLDHDGRFDLLVADMSSTQHYWGKMLMGSMDQHRWFLMHAEPQQYMRNALYVNTGTGRFLEAAHLAGLASTDWTWAVRFADLDDDGWLDFFATNGIPVFTDNPDTGERFAKLWREGSRNQALELFRAIPSVAEKNIARRNDGAAFGGLHFTDAGAAWGLDERSVAHGAAVVDLDRDGDLDVLTNNLNAPCSLFENRGSDAHRVLVELRGDKSNSRGVGAMVKVTAGASTQTAQVSLTRGYMSAGDAVVHFGLGATTTIDALEVKWPSGAMQRFEKLAVDQRYTVVEGPPPQPFPGIIDDFGDDDLNRHWFASSSDGVRHVERDFDDYATQPLLPHRLSRLGPGAAVGDVDGDGRDEYWIGGAAGQAGSLMRIGGEEDEAIPGPWRDDAECEDLGTCFLDFDRDGDLDLYVASGSVEAGERTELLRDRLYVNDGKGAFTRAPGGVLPDLRDSSSCVSAADFDRDGDLDLFVGTRVVPGRFPQSGPSRLLRNDGGRFVDVAAEVAPGLRDAGMVASALWTDVDADGFVDLVVAASWQPVRVFGNERGERLVDRTQALGLSELRGQWNGLAAGDLDGDGDVDLVATNLGLNTKYKASPQKPLRLYARDFDGNGTFDVVESKTASEGELPVRGLSCSSQAMPFVRERFPTYDQFARAKLGDIYGEALGDSLVLECNELRHVVLEQRDGRFHAAPLPWLAQVSTAFGVGITDWDADGLQDLVLVHNFFSPEPETGRSDGGLGVWLRGRSGMQFEPVPAREFGLSIAGDGKALAVAHTDGGDPVLLVTCNDGPMLRCDNSSRIRWGNPGSYLAVRLRGPAGNPTGVGARVELLHGEKVLARGEVQAGGSYLAQGSPSVVFARVPEGARVRVHWSDGATTEAALAMTFGRMEVTR
ncbi:MAG: VCBS repeat-containing protein, partial [Planctomycetes bacterium]|nr:VCBS repeat-containing protein [Planctomycetota bacterium]